MSRFSLCIRNRIEYKLTQRMSNSLKIKEFIKSRIAQIDSEYQMEKDQMKKISLTTTRISFANILNTYLNQQAELAVSYLKHSDTYYHAQCYDQAIYYAQLTKKHSRDVPLLEKAVLINLNSLLKLGKIQEAYDQLKDSTKGLNSLISGLKVKQFYQIQAQIMEKMRREDDTMQILDSLQKIIEQNYGQKSVEMGLFLFDKGRKLGAFDHCSQCLAFMQKGMNVLIEVRYRDQLNISRMYIEMASFNRLLNDLESEFSSLICGHSMMRQLEGMEKELGELMHKIADNLWQREQFQACLKELIKIQSLEKHIYGESSYVVGKTLKKISETLIKLNRKVDAKKYDLEYSRIVSCNDRKGMARDKPLKYVHNKTKQ